MPRSQTCKKGLHPHPESSEYLEVEFLEEEVIETEVLDEEVPEEVLQLMTNDSLQSVTSHAMEQVPRANWQIAINGVIKGGGGRQEDLPAAITNEMGCIV